MGPNNNTSSNSNNNNSNNINNVEHSKEDHMEIPYEELDPREYLGAGNFGFVYKGTWKDRTVAIKQVNIAGTPGITVQDVIQEVKRASNFAHPNVCGVYGYCIIDTYNVWLVLEYVEGGNLRSFLNSDAPTLTDENIQYLFCLQATMAVDYMHTYTSFLHRDIKSNNFLIRGDHLLLADFGQIEDKNRPGDTSLVLADFGLVKEQDKVGDTGSTPNYSAPEVLGSKVTWTTKADIYSLGMVFYEIAAKHIPFEEEHDYEQLSLKIQAGIRPEIPQSCDARLAEIIGMCLAHDPDKRPTSNQLLTMLTELLPNIQLGWTIFNATIHRKPKIIQALIKNHGVNVEERNSKGQTPLTLAADVGHLGTVAKLIELGADLDAVEDDGYTPLMIATFRDHKDVAVELMDRGADINKIKKTGGSALTEAALKSTEIGIELIKRGAAVDRADEYGSTPIVYATLDKRPELVRELLLNGANPTQITNTGQCLVAVALGGGFIAEALEILKFTTYMDEDDARICTLAASYYGYADIVAELLRLGADVNWRNENDETLVLLAAAKGHKELLVMLLNSGANIDERNIEGWTALMAAATEGQADTAVVLIECGAQVDLGNYNNDTPLIAAASGGLLELTRKLIKHGANVNGSNDDGQTPLMGASTRGRADTMRELLKHGANVNAKDNQGRTPLIWALEARDGLVEAVEVLLENGAKVNEVSSSGDPALMLAVVQEKVEVVSLLLKHGAKTRIEGSAREMTPLIAAAHCGYSAIVAELLKYGAKTDEKTSKGATPLMLAANAGHSVVVGELLKHGVAEKDIQSAIKFATGKGHTEIVNQLQQYLPNVLNST